MAFQPRLILQLPRDGELARRLDAPAGVVVEPLETDAEGTLVPPGGGEVVLAVPSPETLRREADEVRRVIARAGSGDEPLIVEVEVAEDLRDDELAAVLDAATHSSRPVILRILS